MHKIKLDVLRWYATNHSLIAHYVATAVAPLTGAVAEYVLLQMFAREQACTTLQRAITGMQVLYPSKSILNERTGRIAIQHAHKSVTTRPITISPE